MGKGRRMHLRTLRRVHDHPAGRTPRDGLLHRRSGLRPEHHQRKDRLLWRDSLHRKRPRRPQHHHQKFQRPADGPGLVRRRPSGILRPRRRRTHPGDHRRPESQQRRGARHRLHQQPDRTGSLLRLLKLYRRPLRDLGLRPGRRGPHHQDQ